MSSKEAGADSTKVNNSNKIKYVLIFCCEQNGVHGHSRQ